MTPVAAAEWRVTKIAPNVYSQGESFVSQAIGIDDEGIVVGYSMPYGGGFAFSESKFGYAVLDVRGVPDNDYSKILGVTNDGIAYGTYYFRSGPITWHAKISDLNIEVVGGVSSLGIIQSPTSFDSPPASTNTTANASAELIDFASSLGLSIVGVNALGQAAANSTSGQQLAYFISPVPEPSNFALFAMGITGVLLVRRQSKKKASIA